MCRETEDILSAQVEAYHLELIQNSLRNKIRQQAEERLKQEEQERERKRLLAEERRQAVLDRIKKKKEEEEEAIRLAKLREQVIQEELIRLIEVNEMRFIYVHLKIEIQHDL